jgi:hypothetical protein
MKFQNQFGDTCEVKNNILVIDVGIAIITMEILRKTNNGVIVKDSKIDGSFVETEMKIVKHL